MEIIKAFQNNELNMHVTIKGTHENPLFRASDIGAVLELSNINKNISDFSSNERVSLKVRTMGGEQEVTFLTEKGLYKILFASRKPIAKQFQDWVCEVIKEIRLKGKYDSENQVKNAIKSKELNLLANFSKTPINYIGFAEENVIKTGQTDDAGNRIKDHKREINPDFTFEYVYESVYNREIERRLYQNPEMKKRRFSKVYPGRKEPQTELFKLDSEFTINDVDKIIKEIKKEVESEENNKNKDAEINKLQLKLKISELENNMLKNEIEHLRNTIVEYVLGESQTSVAPQQQTEEIKESPIKTQTHSATHQQIEEPQAPEVPSAPIEAPTAHKRKNKKCLDCDKMIWIHHERCNKCASIINSLKNRKVENRPTIEEINEFLKTMTMTDIAVKYGVSSNAIKKWIKLDSNRTETNGTESTIPKKCIDCNCDLFRKSPRCQSCTVKLANSKEPVIRPDKETLENLLKTMSKVEIATRYKTSDTTVRKWIKVYEIY